MLRAIAILFLAFGLGTALTAAEGGKTEKKDEAKNKDPLAKFSEENLADVGFCFQEFVKAADGGDAEVLKAFLAEVPKNLAGLDLKKKEDRDTFVQAYASMKGAQIVKHQRIAAAGLAVVTYADSNGAEKTCRWQNVAAVWKFVGE